MPNSNSIVIAVVLGVVIALRQWTQKPSASLPSKTIHAILPAVAAGIAAFVASYAVHYLNASSNRNEALDKTIEQAENTPLIGAILRDEPQYKQKLREAIQSNNGSGRELMVQLRQKYAKPTIWSASDETVLAALAQAARVRDYLQNQSPRLCSEYLMTGIKNLDDLKPEGRQIFNDSLTAMERVYQEGKGQAPRAVPPNSNQVDAFYQIMGFTQAEGQALNNNGSDEVRCTAGAKIYSAISRLKPEFKALFARYLLSQS